MFVIIFNPLILKCPLVYTPNRIGGDMNFQLKKPSEILKFLGSVEKTVNESNQELLQKDNTNKEYIGYV